MKKTILLFLFVSATMFCVAQNVGIGTTNPLFKLHVTGGDLYLNTASGTIRLGYLAGNQWAFSSIGAGSTMLLRSSPDGTNFTTRHRFEQNGDVALGSDDAAVARLLVKDDQSSFSSSTFMLKNSLDDTLMRTQSDGKSSFRYNSSLGRIINVRGNGINLYNENKVFGGAIFPGGDDNLTIWTGIGGVMALQPAWGSVTIGGYTPAFGYVLSVNGKTISEEVKVQLSGSWPDYVFDKKYDLMPLDELRASINKNQHLPNIPSAAAVTKENGIELGEMNRKLLEKVEELTLYILDINDSNKALKNSVQELSSRLAALESKMK